MGVIGEAISLQRADLLIQRGVSLRMLGETDVALESLTQALAMLPQGATYERMLAHLNLGYLHFHGGRQAESIAAEEQALALAKKTKNAPNELIITSNLAAFRQVAGDWQQAAAGYAAAAELAQQTGNENELARVQVNQGVLALYQGDLETAQAALEFSLDNARNRGNTQTIVTALLYLCKIQLAAENPASVPPLLSEAEKLAAESQMAYQLPMIHELHAQLLLFEGDTDEAEERIRLSIEEARRQKMPSEEGIGLRVLGQIQALRGEKGEAFARFGQSLACLPEDPYEAAQTQMAWGKLLIETGEDAAGHDRVGVATEIFTRLGARSALAESSSLR